MNDYNRLTDQIRHYWTVQGIKQASKREKRAAEFDCWIAEVKAEAWAEGHKHSWRRGPDECQCSAWSWSECGCGKYGTGELLSLNDNPYREETE